MRCDRISLMHAGKVLVYDTPQHLIDTKGAADLEEAFISYIEDAVGISEEGAPPVTGTLGTQTASREGAAAQPPAKRAPRFSPTRLLAYSYSESMSVLRDPVWLTFAFVGSMLLLLIMAFGITQDVTDLSFAALDLDQTSESRAYLRNFSGSRYFIEKPDIKDLEDLAWQLKAGEITLAIEIPPGFGRDVTKGSQPEISAWIDGANTMRAGTIEAYVGGGHNAFLTELARGSAAVAGGGSAASIKTRNLYNPTSESIYSMGPSVPAMLLLLFPAILMAVSVAREKEIGTISNFYVTPASRIEFLVGKQLPYIAIGMANYVIPTLLVVVVLQVPFKGSVLALTLGAFLYVVAATSYGLLISSMTKS
ncbi:ABC transporter permease [Actibacterium sp. D379-3]